jgi:cytochrome b subunit of formate dehydrogenase
MADSLTTQARSKAEAVETQKTYTRFDLSQRIEHAVLLVSFSILGITGLAQKYATTMLGEATLDFFGGIETSRIIHRSSAVVLMAVSIYHIVAVLYRLIVKRHTLTMLPVPQDFIHLYHDVLYYIGRRSRKAYYDRYSYAEKAEYLAVVWGTVIMAITGFMMWNPIATTRFLPGEWIPAAKAAHGGEALLAVLAIILWHFYHVHIRQLNKSMFTGKLTREEMEEEHPAELARIESQDEAEEPPQEVIRKRQRIFFPLAAVLTLTLGLGLVRFVTLEETAIETVPQGETAPIFVPFTPTPSPTPFPTPTPPAGGIQVGTSWEDGFSQLFEERCGTCHVQNNLGGLSLATYQGALTGGNSGPAIVPGDPQASLMVEIQLAGGHPGQLTEQELAEVIQWIEAGAPEQ